MRLLYRLHQLRDELSWQTRVFSEESISAARQEQRLNRTFPST
jgi:hypothetical protein